MIRRAYSRSLWLLLTTLSLGLVSACDDGGGEESEPPREPISVDRTQRGFGIFGGDGTFVGGLSVADELPNDFQYQVIRSQLLDEIKFSREGDAAEASSLFAARVDDLLSEIGAAVDLDGLVLVLDLMKYADGSQASGGTPYLTVWDRNVQREPDRYGFWRDDYREAVLDEVRDAAMEQQPDYFIIGAEMERFLDMPGGESDYANFITLYREAYRAVKEVSPNTRVGAGINWLRLRETIGPRQQLQKHEIPKGVKVALEPGAAVSCDALPADPDGLLEEACAMKAFARYVEPLLHYPDPTAQPVEGEKDAIPFVSTADVLALAAIADPSDFDNVPANCPEDFFEPLVEWSEQFPVAYYQVDWRTPSATTAAKKAEWYEVLVDRSKGMQVELFAWALFRDLINNDCDKLRNDLGAPNHICFQGLYSASGAPKDVFDVFTTDVTGSQAEE